MIEAIKNLINRKEEFMESAKVIYEDAIDDIENCIVDEDDQVDSDVSSLDDTLTIKSSKEEDNDNDDVNDDDSKEYESDIMDTSIDDTSFDDDTDILNTKLDNADNQDDDSDIFNISIDLKTNTLTDVLPVPPMNAGDTIVDDIMSTEVDDAFDESAVYALSDDELNELIRANYSTKDPIKKIQYKLMNGEKLTNREAAIFRLHYTTDGRKLSNIGSILMKNYKGEKIPANTFTEAISIDASADDENTKGSDDTDTKGKDKDDAADEKGEESIAANSVTDAVIDKVNEVKTTPVDVDVDTGSAANDDTKAKLLDKLDKLNKNIVNMKEDIKKYIS